MTHSELRKRRVSAGIPGRLLAARAKVDRARLSELERGYVQASEEEHRRLQEALDDLVHARERVAQVAAEVGWPMF